MISFFNITLTWYRCVCVSFISEYFLLTVSQVYITIALRNINFRYNHEWTVEIYCEWAAEASVQQVIQHHITWQSHWGADITGGYTQYKYFLLLQELIYHGIYWFGSQTRPGDLVTESAIDGMWIWIYF